MALRSFTQKAKSAGYVRILAKAVAFTFTQDALGNGLNPTLFNRCVMG